MSGYGMLSGNLFKYGSDKDSSPALNEMTAPAVQIRVQTTKGTKRTKNQKTKINGDGSNWFFLAARVAFALSAKSDELASHLRKG
jgi:hypothetical protein